jgi:c-di-GMP-binding flagellar brake protein YcgR
MSADVSEGWSDRRRAHEDEYFRKHDQELVERARLRAEHETASGAIFGFRAISDKEQRAVDRMHYELERKDAPSPHR